jgi:hypothetical protein
MTAILPKSLDYTDRDFDSLRLRLQSLVRSVFPEWSDFNVANFGNILLEMMAHVGDVVGKYQDAQARESRLVTATQRKNVLNHAKMLAYAPQGAAAARVDLVMTFTPAPTGTLTITTDAIASTADVTSPVVFHPESAFMVSPGQQAVHASFENAERANDTYTSTGLASQAFTLRTTPFLDGSAIVTAGNGVFVQVESLLGSGPSDKHFTVSTDQADRATVHFGTGINGTIPVGSISIDYKTGGGSAGNVDPGTINRFPGTYADSLGNEIRVACANPTKADGGRERQSIAAIQAFAPLTVRATDRSVGREDFEIHARKVPGVARALMTTSNEDAAVAENSGILYIVPDGGGPPSLALKQAVAMAIGVDYPASTTFQTAIQDPAYRIANVAMVVFFRAGIFPPTGAAAIRAALGDFFAVSNDDGSPNEDIDFGFNFANASGDPDPAIAFSDIFDVVRDVPAVRKISGRPGDFLINGAQGDLKLAAREFPKLGRITILDGDTGQTL